MTERAVRVRAAARTSGAGTVAWRAGIAIGGLVVILVGVVLLVFPGPGWLVIFLGIGIWGTEFEWASRLLAWTKAQVFLFTAWAAARPRWLQVMGSALTAAVIAAAIIGYLWWQNWGPFG